MHYFDGPWNDIRHSHFVITMYSHAILYLFIALSVSGNFLLLVGQRRMMSLGLSITGSLDGDGTY